MVSACSSTRGNDSLPRPSLQTADNPCHRPRSLPAIAACDSLPDLREEPMPAVSSGIFLCSALTVWNVHQGIGAEDFHVLGNHRLISGLNVAISGHRKGLNRPIMCPCAFARHPFRPHSGKAPRSIGCGVSGEGEKDSFVRLSACSCRRSLEIALRPHGLVCHHGALGSLGTEAAFASS